MRTALGSARIRRAVAPRFAEHGQTGGIVSDGTSGTARRTRALPKTLRSFRALFVMLCIVAALRPFGAHEQAVRRIGSNVWPSEFDGRPLQHIQLSDTDARFAREFPGDIAKFTDGNRQFIFRQVAQATRKLHSSADCFRGVGYAVSPAPAMRDNFGRSWTCFAAKRGAEEFVVRERINDQSGGEWTDVSAWYWSVLLGKTPGPWTAITIVERKSI